MTAKRPRGRADLHGRGNDRNAARRLTPREMVEFGCLNVLRPGDCRRLAGIEDFRRALNDRFGAASKCEETAHG